MFSKEKNYLVDSNLYYDLSTKAYQNYFGEHFHLFLWRKGESRQEAIARTNKMFLADGKLTKNSHVVDLGCGIGSLSLLIARKYGCKVVGININSHQLEIARKRASKAKLAVDFIEQDIMELDLGMKFDTAFFIDVEPHLPDRRAAIKRIKNVLRGGGRIVMTAWLTNEKPNFAQREFLIKPYSRVSMSMPFFETFKRYRNIFDKESLRIVKFEDLTEKVKSSVDDAYEMALKVIKDFDSMNKIFTLVSGIKKTTLLKEIAGKKSLTEIAENIFLGPIYAKICMDAGVFKLGYFVLEKD